MEQAIIDNDYSTHSDDQPDVVGPTKRVRLEPIERERRVTEARDFARRTKIDPRETAVFDEIEALQTDNPIP